MLNHASVFVVIPAFNEASQIAATIAPLLATGYSIVLVDDCSSDQTELVVKNLPIHYIKHPINLGQGAALQTGMQYAVKAGAKFVVHFDADGQHDYREIPNMLQPLLNGQADVVLGTRFLRKEDVAAIPLLRRMVLRVAILVNGFITGLWLSDAHNGFRAFTINAASKIKITENRMAHATEILSLIKAQKFSVAEVPVHIQYSNYSKAKGQSSLNSINILIDLILNKLF
jgi:glycosyltransferase involved in cell wall biosynthesis